jgi:GMP synthase-like glutamine amidotransferase
VTLGALVVQHEEETPPGLVAQWLAHHWIQADEVRIDLAQDDVDPTGHDLVVSLGAEFAAFDDHLPHVPREARLMRRALDADVPVLGLCYGGQLLARVLGGTVFRSDVAEIGWLPVRTTDAELVSEGPWFQWHFDCFTLPPSAQLIAESDVGPQAFVSGRSLGLQFHPEVTPEIMDDWVRVYRHELDAEGVDPAAILADTAANAERNTAAAWQLLERFFDVVAGLGQEAARP